MDRREPRMRSGLRSRAAGSAGTLVFMLGLALAGPGAGAATLSATVLDRSGHPVRDAVVTATAVNGRPARPEAPAEGIVDQVDKTFVPYVSVVRADTQVRFPNSDNIRHHVYSFSAPKRFELPLYAGRAAPPVLFDRPGVVAMGCNIHDWMVGFVYVADTPWFGRTEDDGMVRIRDLVPGEYILQVWHPDMDGAESSTARTVHVVEAEASVATWKIDLHASLRPRRAPVPGNQGY
jgi:plastocyanin